MKKIKPLNTTADGCAFTIVTRYEGRAYLKSMTGGRLLSLHGGLGDIVGYVNSSQDGAICHLNSIVIIREDAEQHKAGADVANCS